MRARGIKPGFFVNGELVALPPLVRLLFVGLWCAADRAGRLKDAPASIKLAVLPGDGCDVDEMLSVLNSAGFIVRYEVEGQGYIQVVNFPKHQTPHIKERDSVIPAPDLHGANTIQTPEQHPLTPDSGLLTPDYLTPDSPRRRESVQKVSGGPDEFEAFWKLYPKKQDRGHAEKAWTAALKKTDAATIIAGLERLLPDLAKRERQYIPLAATWLSGQRWTDEPESSSKPAHTPWVPPAPEPTREEREEAAKKFGALAKGKGIDTFNAMMGRGIT